MKLRRLSASLLLVGAFLCLCTTCTANSLYGKVVEIVDGDTLVISSLNRSVRIRVMAIDAPELNQTCGDLAKQHLLELISEKMVAVEYYGLSQDGSIDGKVFLNEMDIGAQMVRDGVAWFDKTRANRLNAIEQQRYADSEAAARKEQRGIWREIDPTAPWDFRDFRDFRQGRTSARPAAPAANESGAAASQPAKKSLTNDDLGLDRFSRGQSYGSGDPNKTGDRVESIVTKDLFKQGAITFRRLETSPTALPSGFGFYEGYDIRSEAIAVGHDITFSVPSATDPTLFARLRVLHLESDDMDPGRPRWVDRTVLTPPSAPNFETKTLRSTTYQLGQFVIATLGAASYLVPPAIGLAVTIEASPRSVVPGDVVRYKVTVKNDGPFSATEVMLNSVIDMRLRIASATPSQGACKRSPRSDDTVICELDSIAPGEFAWVIIETKLVDGHPLEVLKSNHIAMVRANERHANSLNPRTAMSTTVRLAQ